ncbi:hypothetical protein MKW92_020976 [Papaver armeniacum]|nr:hypothetical protein MKW92_020976 [Papaver armeniacum]
MVSFNEVQSFHVLLVHLYFLVFLFIGITQVRVTAHGCHVEERKALLNIKSSLYDPTNRLISWGEGIQNENCCNWHGIRCSNDTFHVISIDLRNRELESYQIEKEETFKIERELSFTLRPPNTMLQGKISPSLFNISHLEYLDLAYNDFQESVIPLPFSVLPKLVHLDLSFSNFSASSPSKFTNLSSLQYLDLSCQGYLYYRTSCLQLSSTKWVTGLVSLQVLRLSGISLNEATSGLENVGEHILYLSNLRDLDLSYCDICSPIFLLNQFHNLSRLSSLKMNNNYMVNGTLFNTGVVSPFPAQLSNLTSLSILELVNGQLGGSPPYLPQLIELDVSRNFNLHLDLTKMFRNKWPKLKKLWIENTKVTGSIEHLVSNAPVLVSFDASHCSIQGALPSSLSNLSQLKYVDLGHNSITGDLPSSISNLKHLYHLNLDNNNIQGPIPNSMCEMTALGVLHLGYNTLTGTIPSCIIKLHNLSKFRIINSSIEGSVSFISLVNELNLAALDLSSNMKLTVVIDEHLNVYPNRKLKMLRMTSTNLKGSLNFICNLTGLVELELSRANLTGTIPSCLFKLKYLNELHLANNMLSGILPLPPQNLSTLDISNNKLSGKISIETGKRLSNAKVILLYGNELSGSIPFSIYPTQSDGGILDLSDNKLTGSIRTNIGRGSTLASLNLGNNNLTGIIPKELEFAKHLKILLLNDNHLEGTINFISGLHSLEYLNLANNNFEGRIPATLGSLQDLNILSLRANKLYGPIPEEILHLQELCVLDLSLNNLSGHIPTKLGNLSGLTISNSCFSFFDVGNNLLSLLVKGNLVQLKRFYDYSSVVDLSCNSLDGNIPKEIVLVKALSSLNLSNNRFSDDIPENIGDLSALESLDLSSNRLSGNIPQSLTTIDTLGVLNFSYNNLSGRIPRGNHFDTLGLDGSVFIGNDLLCGFPTETICEGDHNISTTIANPSNEVDQNDQDDFKDKLLLCAIIALGFGIGFWGLFLVLLLKKDKWWFPYWRIVNHIAVTITDYFQNH